MLYSTHWLQEYISTTLPSPKKLEDLLSLHAFEVEALRQTQDKRDWILDIDVLPNRAHDCLNHIGVAREIAAITGKKMKFPKVKAVKIEKGTLKPLKVTVDSLDVVPRYKALVVEGIALGKSPKKVQDYLAAVGVKSINNIVDLTNFVMLEMGQPLHVFDFDTIRGSHMRVRASKKGEKLETLDEQELVLPEGVIVIEDAERVIDLAGIKGGKNSGVSQHTKNIVLQAATFHAPAIYKAKKELKYTTQAADIYSHGIDPNLAGEALARANQLLQEWGIGGKIVQVIYQDPQKTKKFLPKHIVLDMRRVESLLGTTMEKSRVKNILQDLGCQVTEKGNVFRVEVPTGRIDITIPEDLVEEICRIYGYENIAAVFPTASLLPPRKNAELQWQEFARDRMKELGFTEVYNYSFIGQKDLEQFAYSTEEKNNLIELENPVSEDFAYLRDSLAENLLKNVHSNAKKENSIRIFELGKAFSRKNKKFEETKLLAGAVLGGNFYAIKGVVDFLLESMGINAVWYDSFQAESGRNLTSVWHKGKSAQIKVGEQEIGVVGEISGGTAATLKIKQSVALFRLNMDKLTRLATEEKEYQPVPKYPSVIRDIAVLVPHQTKVIDLMNAIHAAGGSIVQDIDLFDLFEGGSLPAGKKNAAFHIMYQSNEKTLKGKEVDTIHQSIISRIEQNPAWQVRK